VGEAVESEKLLRRIEMVSVVLLITFTLAALVWFSLKSAAGVLMGGGVVIVSFQALKWQVRRALQRPGKLPSKPGLLMRHMLHFLVTLLFVFVVLYEGLATPLSFLAGFCVMLLSIVVVGGFEFFKMKKGES